MKSREGICIGVETIWPVGKEKRVLTIRPSGPFLAKKSTRSILRGELKNYPLVQCVRYHTQVSKVTQGDLSRGLARGR